MPVKKALAYDTNAKKWIGRVPVTWFDNFPHLSRTDDDGKRSHGANRSPIEAATPATTSTAAPAVSITEKEARDAQDAR